MSQTPKPPNKLESSIDIHEFAHAMKALDLSNIPPQNRAAATMDHLARIMAMTALDPVKAGEIQDALLMKAAIGR